MRLLVCAMETSSNIHLKELKKYLNDDIELVGVYDKELGNPMYDLTKLAIMGFIDAIKKLKFFFQLRDELVVAAKDCDKVLLMDSSGFNLPLARKIKETYPNKEIIYYILPQAWAWKKKEYLNYKNIVINFVLFYLLRKTFIQTKKKLPM